MTFDVADRRSLAHAFAECVTRHPARTALTVYRGSKAATHDELTYAELGRRAAVRAEYLAARLAPGERLVIALPTGTEFVELYLACLLSGVVAVPAPPAAGSSRSARRVAAIVADCTPGLVMTTPGDCQTITDGLRPGGPAVEAVRPVAAPGPDHVAPSLEIRTGLVDPDGPALLQYSSGATGSPKGVMLAHRNVLANLAGLNRLIGLREDDSFGSWMPLHHDFGLYVQLTLPLIHGAHAVLMSPTDFVRRPVEWLRMMDLYGTTASSAPDFAYDMCVRVIPDEQLEGLDLSRLRFLANGSEPIHAPTMAAFGKRFARIGLRPEAFTAGYGMAEVTVYASGTATPKEPTVVVADRERLEDGERPSLVPTRGPGKEVVSVGRPMVLDTRIVHPRTRQPLPDGDIGEIWLCGDSVGLGYWNRPELSEQTFRAQLVGDDEPGRTWLRTGDLGALVGDDLFVTGRLKEILIIRGRNLFPQDVEHEARAAHPALEGVVGAAFGVDTPDERLVLVHEVSPRLPAEQLADVAAAIMQELTVALGVPARNVVLVRRGTVSRTTSGKIQRGTVRRQFLAGEVAALHTVLEPEVRRLMTVNDR